MKHPVEYLARVTRKLDELIRDHGDQLFLVFAFGCLVLIAWLLARRRARPPAPVPRTFIVMLPFSFGPRPERDEERPDREWPPCP